VHEGQYPLQKVQIGIFILNKENILLGLQQMEESDAPI